MTLITAVILLVGFVFGTGMEAGVLGYIAILILAGLFGLAYAGFGLAIALRTGSPQAAQGGVPHLLPAALPLARFRPEGVL